MSLSRRKPLLLLSMYVNDSKKKVGKKEIVGPMKNITRTHIDLEFSTPLVNQVCLVCTQRGAEVDHEAVQAKAD